MTQYFLFVCLFVFIFVFQLTNKDITDSIDAEMDGDLQKAFMTLGGHNIFVIQYFFNTEITFSCSTLCVKNGIKANFPSKLEDLKEWTKSPVN